MNPVPKMSGQNQKYSSQISHDVENQVMDLTDNDHICSCHQTSDKFIDTGKKLHLARIFFERSHIGGPIAIVGLIRSYNLESKYNL